MFFSPGTDFCIDIPDDNQNDVESAMAECDNSLNEKKGPVTEPMCSSKRLKPYRGFLDIMNTMNIKFGYNDGKLSTALDLISLYLKGQKMFTSFARSFRPRRIPWDSPYGSPLCAQQRPFGTSNPALAMPFFTGRKLSFFLR